MFAQSDFRLRCDWGATGGRYISQTAALSVVVDVLSFSTTVTLAVERGIEIIPFPWRDGRAASFAAEQGAQMAVGRLEGRTSPGQLSLSPCSVLGLAEVPSRVVLPSPNGAAIAHALAETETPMVAGSLLNARAVAEFAIEKMGDTGSVALVAAGERWRDSSLRPAIEDFWGVGAIAHEIADIMGEDILLTASPIMQSAVASYRYAADDLVGFLSRSASGMELIEADFAEDISVAARLNTSAALPLLHEGAFRAAQQDLLTP